LETVDSAGDTGHFGDLAVDATGIVHVAFRADEAEPALVYARRCP
jgi:hypothetical protein